MIGGETSGVAIRDGQTIENSGSLPTVDEVLAKYVEAMGGAKAINAVTSRVIKGTLDVAGVSRGGSFETYAQAPNKVDVIQAIRSERQGGFQWPQRLGQNCGWHTRTKESGVGIGAARCRILYTLD